MRILKVILWLLLFLLISNCSNEKQARKYEKIGFIPTHLTGVLDTLRFRDNLPKLHKEVLKCKDEQSKGILYNAIANHYYLLNESQALIKEYCVLAFEHSPDWFCETVFRQSEIYKDDRGLQKLTGRPYFLSLDSVFLDKFNSCISQATLNESANLFNEDYENHLSKMVERDQKHRSHRAEEDDNFKNIQPSLDLLNRRELDSLFLLYGFPDFNKVGERAHRSALLILHHSLDCEWNKKWMLRFFSDHKHNSRNMNHILFTFKRWYIDEKEARCVDDRLEVLNAIEKDYPLYFEIIKSIWNDKL